MSTAPGPRGFTARFSGSRALVTGAASGIGRATVEFLLDCGLDVLALDVREPEVLTRGSATSRAAKADVRDRSQLEQALGALGGGPDYVVNCAGILDPTGFSGVEAAAFARVLDVNLVGAYQVIDVAGSAGDLKAVVNVTSIESSRVVALSDPDPHPAYAASKAALAMLTRTAARALAPQGIRVNAVAPGFVATPMAGAHGDLRSLPPALAQRVPLGSFAQPEQIAGVIAFLLSDEAGYITGSEVVVDGGFNLS